MLTFITRFFALIGFAVVALIVLTVLCFHSLQTRINRHETAAHTEPANLVLVLDFDKAVVERAEPSPFDAVTGGPSPVALIDVLHAIDRARDDSHVKGIVAKFGATQPVMAQAQEIRAAIARFRSGGKFTYAFGTDYGEFGLGNRAYYLASAFDNIWLQPVGSVSLTGVALQSPFGKQALDQLGLVADFMQREEYKSFMEPGQRDGFSPPVKAEMQIMVENLADQIAGGIADSRKWDAAKVKGLMAEGPFTDQEALQNGLVTRLAYADELDDEIRHKAGDDVRQADVATYLAYENGAPEPAAKPTKIAMIYGTGLIVDRDSDGSLLSDHVMGASEIAGAFDAAARDSAVKAILFRIDSPGGSPTASETIRRAMIHAQKQGKPVIVSMGEVAASGGYWIAMNGDRIIADPATLTGSIGVVSGKFANNGGLQKLGITFDGVSTAENAGMWSMMQPFTPAQRARVNALLDASYQTFVGDVAAARKIPMASMPDIAKGRVWTGAQAVKLGLVDELGGYDVALAAVRKSLKLNETDVMALEPFPVQPSAADRVLKLLRRMGSESAQLPGFMNALVRLQSVWTSVAGARFNQPVAAQLQGIAGLHE